MVDDLPVGRDLIRGGGHGDLLDIRWLAEHGFGPPGATPEDAVLRFVR